MVGTPDAIWLGLEYFCQEGDALWSMDDKEFSAFAIAEMEKIGLLDAPGVMDWHLARIPKAYPAYFGTYDEFDAIRAYTDGIENLFLVGRNGMHRYNNQDHSMLTARNAVECILANHRDREALWSVNTEDDYHEEKK